MALCSLLWWIIIMVLFPFCFWIPNVEHISFFLYFYLFLSACVHAFFHRFIFTFVFCNSFSRCSLAEHGSRAPFAEHLTIILQSLIFFCSSSISFGFRSLLHIESICCWLLLSYFLSMQAYVYIPRDEFLVFACELSILKKNVSLLRFFQLFFSCCSPVSHSLRPLFPFATFPLLELYAFEIKQTNASKKMHQYCCNYRSNSILTICA